MTSRLPRFLAIPATHFFTAARVHSKHEPVLIGGAAVGMHGLLQGRYTNDLDINLVDTKWLSAAFGNTGKATHFPHQWLLRSPEVTGRRHYKLTWLDPQHATKLDIVQVDKEEHELQLKHSSVSADGIRYASVPLLMAKKVICFTDRARGSRDPKAVSDFTDLEMLISHIVEYGLAIPEDIKARLLGREAIYGLYHTLENTRFSNNGELDFMILQWMYETGAMPEDVAADLMKRRVISGDVN